MYDDDDRHEKEAARNQLIVFMTMAILLFLWLHYYGPKPQPAATQPQIETIAQQQTPTEKAVGLEVAEAPETGGAEAGWPNLPPIPTDLDPASDIVTLKKDDLTLEFTRIGGRLKRATLMSGEHGNSVIQLVPQSDAPDTESVYPFGLRFTNESLKDELDRRRFDVESTKAVDVTVGSEVTSEVREVVFSLTLPNAAVIKKRFAFADAPHVISATVDYASLEPTSRVFGRDEDPAYTFTWGPNIDSGDLTKGVHQAVIWRAAGTNGLLNTSSMEPDDEGRPYTRRFPDADWLAVRSAYFVVAMKPNYEGADGTVLGDAKEFRYGYMAPRTEVAPGATMSNSFDIYIGPSHLPQLKLAWATLDTSLKFFEWGFFDWFAKLLLQMLNWFYNVVPNYGVAIILLTVVVRMVMFPLMVKQMKTMKRMSLLAPEMEKIKEQYANDQQEMQKKMMELYKEYGMNPVAGCLPMFAQLPIFVALYRMLWSAYELRGASFGLWIKDLSEPDRLFHVEAFEKLPWVFSHLQDINVLPVLSALAMLASVKLTPMSGPVQNPQQKMMMTIMPVFFSVFCYPLASGLNLYILTSTVLGIAQSKLMSLQKVDKPEKVKPKKKQHFYTAAIEKKKLAERQLKEKKRKDKKKFDENRKDDE